MSGDFDPYFKWLSIPPEQQPPNHYRLLGVPEFVDDADVIENAADKQMMMLRTLGTGKHAALSQRLLNEVSSAKLTLLDTMQKAAYDAQLRQGLAAPSAPRTRPTQPALPTAVPVQAATPAPQVSINTVAPSAEKPLWQQPLGLIAIGGTLAALIVSGFLLALNSQEEEASVADVVTPAFPDPPKRPDDPSVQPETRPEPGLETQPSPKLPLKPDPTPNKTSSPQADPRAVDLLSKIDLEKNTLRGKWVLDQGTLRGVANGSILEIDHLVQIPEYDVVVDVQNTNPTCHLTLGLVSPLKRQFYLAMGYDKSGLGTYEGKPFHSNPTTTGRILPHDGKPHTLIYQVRKEGVTLLLDNKQRLQWRGDYSKLTRPQEIKVSSDQVFYLGSQNVAIKKLEFRPLVDGSPAAVAQSPASSQTIDLLAKVDVKKHALTPAMVRSSYFRSIGNECRLENGTLIGSGTDPFGLHFPCELPAEYDLNLVLRRVSGSGVFSLSLAKDRTQFQFTFDPNLCVLQEVKGKRWDDQGNPTRTAKQLFADDRPHSLVLKVRDAGLDILYDGQSILRWTSGYDQLSLQELLTLPQGSPISMLMSRLTMHVEKFELVPLGSSGSIPQTPPVGPVDLLSKLDLNRDTLGGKWTLEQGVLRGMAQGPILQVDYRVRFSEYDVTAEVKSINPNCYFTLGLVSPIRQQFELALGPAKSGLGMLDGKPFHANSTTTGRIMPVDRNRHTLVYQVRKEGVTFLVDGKPRLQWRGDYRQLTRPTGVKVTSFRVFYLGSWNVAIEKLEFQPVTDSDSTPIAQPPTPQPPLARQRHPLPSEEDQQASLTLIKDVFQKEYDDTKTKTQKASLAKKLLVQAGQSRDDLSGRYMLYRESRRLATLGGDSSTAINAAKSLAREYDVDPMAIILETTRALKKTVQFTPQRKALAEITLRLIDEAVADNQFGTVESLIEIALSTARASRDRILVKKVVDRKKDLTELSKAYAAAKKGLETLKEKPDDPLANLIAGRFVCFIQNNWRRGLPMLVKGSDPELKALATADLANPQEGNDRAALGDRWLEISASLEGRMQKNAQQRSIYHYKQSLGRLKGLSRARIEKKLKAMLGN